MRLALALALWGAAAAGAAGAAPPPGAAAEPWAPDVRAAEQFARLRAGEIAFSVRTPARSWHRHADRPFRAASVLKALLLVAYLDRRGVRSRPLDARRRALLARMIRRSDSQAASLLMEIVGTGGLRRLARSAGMTRFIPDAPVWGHSRITARDSSRLFLRIDRLLPERHRDYAMGLLETIVGSQRWGIAEAHPPGWRLFFKGGWGSGSGLVDHQAALLTNGEQRVSLAILTRDNPSHAYGKQTLLGIARRLLRDLPRGAELP